MNIFELLGYFTALPLLACLCIRMVCATNLKWLCPIPWRLSMTLVSAAVFALSIAGIASVFVK